VATFSGALTASDPATTTRLNRSGTQSTCAAPNVQQVIGAGTYHYDAYPVASLINEPACLTAAENAMTCASSGATAPIQDAAYLDSFDPTNPAVNEISTDQASPNPTGTLPFTAPGGHDIVFVVNSSDHDGLCPGYAITLTANRPWATQLPVVTARSSALNATDATYTAAVDTLARSWVRCSQTGSNCSPTGSTGTSYTPTAADSGHTLRFRNTATNSDGTSTTDSLPVSPTLPPPPPPPASGPTTTVPGPTTTVPGPTRIVPGPTRTITYRERTVCKTKKVRIRVHGKTRRVKRPKCRKLLVKTVR
jgi:hypothetical protein